jgi:hypothetical protein
MQTDGAAAYLTQEVRFELLEKWQWKETPVIPDLQMTISAY